MRKGAVSRKTKETDINVKVDLGGTGVAKIATGIGFFDHMLEQLARHSLIDIGAAGDLHTDQHHTVENSGITLGRLVPRALGGMASPVSRISSCRWTQRRHFDPKPDDSWLDAEIPIGTL